MSSSSSDMVATIDFDREVEHIESCLGQWFPHAFTRAAQIMAHPMLPAEQALVANAIRSRQQEFSTGRWLARQGLQHFGLSQVPILMGRLRNPLWPESMLGTITHDAGLCAVALVRKDALGYAGIGIDLVAWSVRTEKMYDLLPIFLTRPEELAVMQRCDICVDPALLLFSIKESVIKALSFYLKDFVDMREVEIHFSDRLQFKISGCLIAGDIFFAATDHYLLTAACAFN